MNIIAKKSLGQNFLKSKVALSKMLEAGEVNDQDIILEVGPGKGILTEKLLEKAKKVFVVEKDDRLIPFLQEKFASEIRTGKLEIIHDDILNLGTAKKVLKSADRTFSDAPYKIIANIPYYITGQFLRKFLATPSSSDSVARFAKGEFRETNRQPERIVVMVQKEIAQRIVALDKKESLLSMSVKAFGQPKIIMKMGKENFQPAPKVDSAILLISNISKKFFEENQISEKSFFALLHAGFAHKRKILISNLRALSPNTDWPKIFNQANISNKTRAEDLTLSDWQKINQ